MRTSVRQPSSIPNTVNAFVDAHICQTQSRFVRLPGNRQISTGQALSAKPNTNFSASFEQQKARRRDERLSPQSTSYI